jgi:hypothetical protein
LHNSDIMYLQRLARFTPSIGHRLYSRSFASNSSSAVEKLSDILEEYRVQKYVVCFWFGQLVDMDVCQTRDDQLHFLFYTVSVRRFQLDL